MPTAEDRERNVKNVIATAIRFFKEDGIADTSQIMIAKAAHLSPRSIQRYFASKTELVGEVVKHVVDGHCEQLLSKFEEYDSKNHTGLENLVYLIKLHSILLEHNTELFAFLDEADMYLRRQRLNGDEMAMQITSVDKLRKVFENAFYGGIEDGSIRNDIDVPQEYRFLNIALTGLLYQIAAHSSHDRVNESKKLQQEVLSDFVNVWMKHLKNAIG